MTTFVERLKFAMEYRGVTATDIAKGIGINKSNISRYFSGQYSAKTENVYKIACFLRVSEPWLAFGIGNMLDTYDEQNTIISTPEIQTTSIPILGKVACGEPIYAPESTNVYTTVNSKLNVDFALVASGDSMIDAGISDGDIVLIKQQPVVETGEIAAVSIDDEVTLKRVYYYPEANKLVLQPANPNYPPMNYLDEELSNVHILGKAVAVQHLL